MLISHVPGEECRIAIIEDGQLEEYYQERASSESHVSNIYKGRITNIEPSIQAAFVDFGLERNGFLHISDVHPMYFPGKDREEFEKVGSKTPRRERPPIQKCFKRNQEVLVQVLKEGIGTKGPTVTSYLSIPGRFLVMMPYMQRLGVTRKVDDEDARKEMRDILRELDPPKEFGFIVRTAGIGQTKTDLKRDLAYLTRLFKSIERKKKQVGRTGELYAESDLMIRTIRDVFTTDIDRVVIDDLAAARRARDFLAVANPRSKSKVVFYDDPVPVFHRFGIEAQIETISAREVPLKSGGALVIDQTEALVAIDVNSGKSKEARDAETNAFKTNEQAVDEICRQLRLRDLGGLVVLDLIDMMAARHRKSIETRMRNNLKRDRARTRIGPISQFGLLEMTRQRMRPSLKKSLYTECPHCQGRGYTMSTESVVLRVMRQLALAMQQKDVARIELTISPDVAFHLLNRKRAMLTHLEERHNIPVLVRVGGQSIDHLHIEAKNEAGGVIDVMPDGGSGKIPAATDTTYRELDDEALPEEEEQPDGAAAWTDIDHDEMDQVLESEPAEATSDEGGTKKKRRRRRRGGRGRKSAADRNDDSGKNGEVDAEADSGAAEADDAEAVSEARADVEATPEAADEAAEEAPKKKRRRRRGGRGRNKKSTAEGESVEGEDAAVADDTAAQEPEAEPAEAERADHDGAGDAEEAPKKKRRRRRGGRGRRGKGKSEESSDEAGADAGSDAGSDSGNAAAGGDASDTGEAKSAQSKGYSNRVLKADEEPAAKKSESPAETEA